MTDAEELAEVDRLLARAVPDFPAMIRRDVAILRLIADAEIGRGDVGTLRKALQAIKEETDRSCCSASEVANYIAESALRSTSEPHRSAPPLAVVR